MRIVKLVVYFLLVVSCTQKGGIGVKNRVRSLSQDNLFAIKLIDKSNTHYSVSDRMKMNSERIIAALDRNDIIVFPKGFFQFDNEIVLRSKVKFIGQGKDITTLEFRPKANASFFFKITNSGSFSCSGMSFVNLGSKSVNNSPENRFLALTQLKANTITVLLVNPNDTKIDDCEFVGGHYGIKVSNANLLGKETIFISNCVFRSQASSGITIENGHFIRIEKNSFLFAGVDGLKTKSLSSNLIIINNIAKGCGRDGFDFYDGLIGSVVSGNLSTDNFYHGYDMKGNPNSEGSYVFSDNVFSDNIAKGNGYYGYSLQNVRDLSMNANKSYRNGKSGFFFNNVQNCVFNALSASKNKEHGFLLSEISRSIFSNCLASDNNYIHQSESTKGGHYCGFYFESKAGGVTLNSCMALNGTTKKSMGRQAFGAFFEKASSNNKLINCDFRFNVNKRNNGVGGAFVKQRIIRASN